MELFWGLGLRLELFWDLGLRLELFWDLGLRLRHMYTNLSIEVYKLLYTNSTVQHVQ